MNHVEQAMRMLEEHLDCFALTGYDIHGNLVRYQTHMTRLQQDALLTALSEFTLKFRPPTPVVIEQEEEDDILGD
jgi:hypothetical protein